MSYGGQWACWERFEFWGGIIFAAAVGLAVGGLTADTLANKNWKYEAVTQGHAHWLPTGEWQWNTPDNAVLDTTPELDVMKWHSINQLARDMVQQREKLEEEIDTLRDAIIILAQNQAGILTDQEQIATLWAMLDTLIGPSEK